MDGKFEIHMILLSLYFIYLSTSLHLSEVSGIFDLLPFMIIIIFIIIIFIENGK